MRLKDRLYRYKRSLTGFWKEYKRSKLGLFSLGILIFYGILAIFAPYIAPYDPSPLNRVGPNFAAPGWLAALDPNAFPTQQLVDNYGFLNDLTGWSIVASDKEAIHAAISDENWEKATPKSLLVRFVDQDTKKSGSELILVTHEIEWKYQTVPADVFIYFDLKGNWTRDYDFSNVKVSVALAPEGYEKNKFLMKTIEKKLPIPPARIKDYGLEIFQVATTPDHWNRFKADLTYIDIYAIFDKPGKVNLILAVEINREAKGVGEIELYFDDIELYAFSHYFGILGTSESGADVFSQLVWGSRVSWIIGVISTAISVAIGVIVGIVAGYCGGVVDEVLMRVVDFLLIIPGLPLMMILATILGRTIWAIVWVIALTGWAGTARLIRSQVLSERTKAYVEAARAAGASDIYIMFRHVLPNVLPLVFVQITLGIAGAILSEAALSFLGLGPAEEATWGKMLQWAFEHGALVRGAWWYVIFPGLAIATLCMGFIFTGYVLDTILNPRLRRR